MFTRQQWIALVLIVAFVFGAFSYSQAATKVKSKKLKAQVVEPEHEEQYEEENRDRVDARELKEVTRQFKDLRSQIKQLNSQAKKLPDSASIMAELNQLAAQVNQIEQELKSPPQDETQRDVLQRFYDARIWDELNKYRGKIELPRQLAELEKELKRVEKQFARKRKKLDEIIVKAAETKLAEIKVVIDKARQLASTDPEEAMEIVSTEIHQDTSPGDIGCVIDSLQGFTIPKRVMKDVALREAIEDIMSPIREAAQEGDFREACQVFNSELRQQMERLMQIVFNSRRVDPKLQQKIDRLGQLMNEKFQSFEQQPQPEMVMPQEGTQPQQ